MSLEHPYFVSTFYGTGYDWNTSNYTRRRVQERDMTYLSDNSRKDDSMENIFLPKYGKCFSPVILQNNFDMSTIYPVDTCKWCHFRKISDVETTHSLRCHPLSSIYGFRNADNVFPAPFSTQNTHENPISSQSSSNIIQTVPSEYLIDFHCSAMNQYKNKGVHSSESKIQGAVYPECFTDKTRKHQCNLCEFSCSNRGQLKGHVRVHTGEKPFVCKSCGKSFARNEELTRHKRIHSGFKPYLCQMCDKKFGRKDHLNKHMKTHLNTSEKKIHACDEEGCDQKYTRSDALSRHQWSSHGIKPKHSKLKLEHFNEPHS